MGVALFVMTLLAFCSQGQQFVAQTKKNVAKYRNCKQHACLDHMDNSKERGPEGMLSKLLKLPVTLNDMSS